MKEQICTEGIYYGNFCAYEIPRAGPMTRLILASAPHFLTCKHVKWLKGQKMEEACVSSSSLIPFIQRLYSVFDFSLFNIVFLFLPISLAFHIPLTGKEKREIDF